jgi:hypothetical protein
VPSDVELERWDDEISVLWEKPELRLEAACRAWKNALRETQAEPRANAIQRAKEMFRKAYRLDPDGDPDGVRERLSQRIGSEPLDSIRRVVLEDLQSGD